MIESTPFYFLAAISVIIAGLGKSGFGGGLGVLSVPLMSLTISPPQAAAIMLPLLCIMDLFTVWHYRKSWDGRNLKILIPAALMGILIGALFFKYLSDSQIKILVGFIAVLFVLNFFRKHGEHHKKQPTFVRGSFWGSIAGFTSFGVHAGGPPINIYLLPQQLEKSLFVGTTVVFFTIVNYTKLIPYALLGQLNSGNLTTSLILSPLAPLGVFLGVKLHAKVNQTLFYNICYVILLVTGLKLLYDGFSPL